jgi:hypothetical protein
VNGDQAPHADGQCAQVEANAGCQLGQVVVRLVDIDQRGPRPRGRRNRLQPLHGQPGDRGGAQHDAAAQQTVAREQGALHRLEQQERDEPVQNELALEESNREDEPAPARPVPGEPQEQHVRERLHVAAVRLEQVRRRPRRRQGKQQRRDRRERRPQAGLPHQAPHQEQRDGDVDGEERQPQRRDRRAGDEEQGSRQPRFDAEHVVLPVVEDRESAELGEVFRHQPDDRLIGVEVRQRPPHEHRGSEEHREHDEAGAQPPLRRAMRARRCVLFGHSGLYHMLRIQS